MLTENSFKRGLAQAESRTLKEFEINQRNSELRDWCLLKGYPRFLTALGNTLHLRHCNMALLLTLDSESAHT